MPVVHVAVYDTLADWEPSYALSRIHSPMFHKQPGRYTVRSVGTSAGPVTTMGGLRILPDVVLNELHPDQSAMLILPGADLWEQGALEDFARKADEFLQAGVPVAAICGATAGLARAGLLDVRKHTSSAKQYLEATGYKGASHYLDEKAVSDGDLITGSPLYPVDFAREIFKKLDLFEDRVLEAWYSLFGKGDPSAFAALQPRL